MRRQGALRALCALLLALVATGASAQDDAALTLRIWGGGMPPGSEMTIAWTPGQGLRVQPPAFWRDAAPSEHSLSLAQVAELQALALAPLLQNLDAQAEMDALSASQAEVGPGGTLYYSSDPHWIELTIGPSLAGGVARTIRLRGLDEAVRRATGGGGLPALKQLVDRIYLLALQARGVQ